LETAKSEETGMKIHLALVTSSSKHHFEMKTDHLEELFGVFKNERMILGDDKRISKSKPSPDIYLLALKTINDTLEGQEDNIKPEECLGFEDAILGVVAGRRAGMRVLWVPHPELAVEYQGRETLLIAGLGDSCTGGEFGTIYDGMADQLTSLADFPSSRYGIVTGN
jgi:pseudouridine-5'-monophosphatase